MKQLRQVTTLPSRAAIAIILRYQSNRSGGGSAAPVRTESGPGVLVESIARQGLIVGGVKGCWRVARGRDAQGMATN